MKNKKSFSLAVAALILASCASGSKTSLSESPEKLPFLKGMDAVRFRLANGLKVLFVRDTSSPTFAYQTWYHVGSKDEAVGRTGLAHFFEHMMFKGTKNLKEGEFDRTLDRAGAQGMNAYTTQDHTTYVVELPRERFEMIARLESDRMQNLVIDEESFRTEREVVKNERRFRTENSPEGAMFEELLKLTFRLHPYHWPVIGWEKDLDSMSAKDAEDFYKAHYEPATATIAIVGDLSFDEVRDVIHRYYGEIQSTFPVKNEKVVEPKQTRALFKSLKLSLAVPKLAIAYRVGPLKDPDTGSLDLIQTLLTDGKDSRLKGTLVRSGIASDVYSGSFGLEDPGLFIIVVTLQKGRDPKTAQDVVLRELKKLSQTPPSEAEWDRTKNATRFQFYSGLDSPGEKAQFLGRGELFYGDYRVVFDSFERAMQMKREDVPALIKKYFNPEQRVVVEGVPR